MKLRELAVITGLTEVGVHYKIQSIVNKIIHRIYGGSGFDMFDVVLAVMRYFGINEKEILVILDDENSRDLTEAARERLSTPDGT